jgi:hypothetical protein
MADQIEQNVVQQGNQQITQPENAQGRRIDELGVELRSTTRELKDDSRDQKTYMVLGLFIIIIMVVTILVMVLLSWMDTVGSLQQQVYQLELNQVNTAKIDSTK